MTHNIQRALHVWKRPKAATGVVKRILKLSRKINFAHFLRNTRIKRGLSVAEVADLVGVSQASIYFWERNHCRPKDANLAALCRALKLPIRATRAMATG